MEILKFSPIFKPTLWGSETWVVSAVKGSESIATNGIDKGLTLPEIVSRYGADFLGKKNFEKFGNDFPLLIKFIDARQDLSIQVHPDDALSAKRHGKMGKNEMWYVVDADRGSQLIAGFRQKIETSDYAQKVADGSIEDDLNKVNVSEGDCFYIPAGRVHGIGAGMVIAEIQQTSDVTYRIYDYLRRDRDGNLRELHTELAKDAIDYRVFSDYRTHYLPCPNRPVELVNCDYFTTSLLDLNQPIHFDHSAMDSFVIYIGLEDNCEFTDEKGEKALLHAGQTLLVPASNGRLNLRPVGTAKLLEVHI